MNNLPPAVLRARILLRSVAALPGAEARIYRRIQASPRSRSVARWRLAVVTLGVLSVGSFAYGLGLLPTIRWSLPPVGFAHSNAAHSARVPPRTVSRQARGGVVGSVVPTALPPEQTNAPIASAVSRELAKTSVPNALQREHGGHPADTVAPLHPTRDKGISDRHGEPPGDAPAVTTPPAGITLPPPTAPAQLPAAVPQSRRPTLRAPDAPPTDAAQTVDSDLNRQIAAYRAAMTRLSGSPASALELLQQHRRTWPNSAIAHEVDLRTIQALIALGRNSEAQTAAKRFLQRYPQSPQAAVVRRLVDPTVRVNRQVD